MVREFVRASDPLLQPWAELDPTEAPNEFNFCGPPIAGSCSASTMKVGLAMSSAAMFWTLVVTFDVGSFFLPVMENAELQANIVLTCVVPVDAASAARLYYHNTAAHGVLLGTAKFAVAGVLDALVCRTH